MKGWVLIAVLLFGLAGRAQEIKGFWKGTLDMRSSCFPVNHIELQLEVDGSAVTGYSYHYQDIDYYVKKTVRGTYNAGSKQLYLSEGLITTLKIPPHCKVCIKNFRLLYSRENDKEYLTGSWDGRLEGTGEDCLGGPIRLSRIRESAFKEIPEIAVDTGEIRLDFYDNAEVDGDSITVRVNKQVILTHQRLTTKPLTAYVRVDLQSPLQEVEMLAENEGSIPPNTALLIITAGSKRYQLFLTSTEIKSARVRFVYEPPEGTR